MPSSLNVNQLCGLTAGGRGTYTTEGIVAICDMLKVNGTLTSLSYAHHSLNASPKASGPFDSLGVPCLAVSTTLTHARIVVPQPAKQPVERFRQTAAQSSRGRPHQALALSLVSRDKRRSRERPRECGHRGRTQVRGQASMLTDMRQRRRENMREGEEGTRERGVARCARG